MEERKSNVGIQLDLFAGILLTTEQQGQVNKYIENQKKNSEYAQNKHKQIVELLLENDFVEGVHFEQSCKVTTETRKTTLGYNYNNTAFETEIEYEKCDSQIYLLGQNFNVWETAKQLKPAKFWFEVEGGKILCSSITEQYRYYKPKTILEKLQRIGRAHV